MAIKIQPAVAFFVSSDGDEYKNRRVRGAEGEREAFNGESTTAHSNNTGDVTAKSQRIPKYTYVMQINSAIIPLMLL